MKEKKIEVEILRAKALLAREKAYVPYSSFAVGAALLSKSGKIYTGCNVENASYGLTNCAERTAFFKAISEATSNEDSSFEALLIIGETEAPISPCGACRQVIFEFCEQEMPVYLYNMKGDNRITTVGELLPGGFGPSDLRS